MELTIRFNSLVGLCAFLCCGVHAQTNVTVNSLTELRNYANADNHVVTLAAGNYWLKGDGTNPNFLDFSGSNSMFDLSAAKIKIDTRDLAGYGNSNGVRPVTVTGNDSTILGLDLAGVDVDLDTDPNARRFSDRSGVYLQVTGNNNTIQDATLLVRGSDPYGLGDAFGKGGRPSTGAQPVEDGGTAWISHRKTSAFLVTNGATNTVVDNLDLTSQSYGHGFFMQNGATNTTIRNSTITGELVSSNTVIANPEYQEYAAGADGILGTPDDGGTSRGTPISPNIQLSAQEDGIRMYGNTTGLTVENVVVTNMRSGVHSTFGNGTITIDNVEAYGTENAFVPGSNTTITNSKGDIVNGPLVYVQYNGKSNTTIDVELVGDVPVGVDWAVAYLNGSNFDVTVSSDLPAGALPADSLVRFGQTWFNNWRDREKPTGPEDADPGPFTNSTFTNNTNQMVVLGNLAEGNTGSSQAPVVTNGKDNAYDGISIVLPGTHVTLTDASGLGNNGNLSNGDFDADLLESNASIVADGATLELQPELRITNEKLTITGDGVDGNGALYSDGSENTNTRFGSTNANDRSTIFLDGDASIGVGVAGNQLIVGRIQGDGDLTKRGAGSLQISKSSTYDGDLIIEAGHVTARPGVVHRDLTVAAGASISPLGTNAYNTAGNIYLDGEMDLNGRSDANSLSQQIGLLHGGGTVISSNNTPGSQGILTIAAATGAADFSGVISTGVNLIKSGDGTQTLSGDNTYTGTTTVNGGTLLVNASHTGGGTYTVNDGGTIGGGGVVVAPVNVTSGGTVSPGISPGTLYLSDLTLNAGAKLDIELAGTAVNSQYDRLSAATATLGGDLNVSLLHLAGGETYTPGSTDAFTVLSASSSLTGSFANVLNGERLDTVGGEGSFLVSYGSGSNAVVLSDFASALGLTGDFNGDGFVSQADLDLVLLNWGGTTVPGDFDEANLTGGGPFDGLMSQNELDDVLLNWGNGTPPNTNAIPEPGTTALLSTLLLLNLHQRRRIEI